MVETLILHILVFRKTLAGLYIRDLCDKQIYLAGFIAYAFIKNIGVSKSAGGSSNNSWRRAVSCLGDPIFFSSLAHPSSFMSAAFLLGYVSQPALFPESVRNHQ